MSAKNLGANNTLAPTPALKCVEGLYPLGTPPRLLRLCFLGTLEAESIPLTEQVKVQVMLKIVRDKIFNFILNWCVPIF